MIRKVYTNKIYIISSVVLAVAGAWWVFSRHAAPPAIPAPRVTVVQVTKEPWVEELEALGTARANESLTITSNVSETIAEINFTDGQEVKSGDPIVSLALGEEAAAMAAANARLSEEKRELARLAPLIRSKTISQRTYDERKTTLEVAERAVQQIKARVDDRVITAPFAGVLGLRYVSIGALVEPGDVITTLDDIDTIKLDFTMPASYLSSVKVGTQIKARASEMDGAVFSGEVASLDSRIDPDTRSLIVRALLPNPQHSLKPGMLMYVALQNNPREALTIPEEAIVPRGKQFFSYTVNGEEKIEQREVRLGSRKDGKVEILSGLQEGERVIIRGQNKARAGQKVMATLTDGLTDAPREHGKPL